MAMDSFTAPPPPQADATPAQGSDFAPVPEAAQAMFHRAVLACARKAETAAGAIERTIAIAGVRVRLVFAGSRLHDEFFPALSHLEVADGAAPVDAVFRVWDTESSGVAMVRPPCKWNAFTSRGDIWGMESSRFRSAFHFSEYSVCTLDLETGEGCFWVETASTLPFWAKSSPMRSMFNWLLVPRGAFLLHAAVVGTEHGGVLVTGKGGVGKSTTALVALEQGMQFAGDDYVVVTLNDDRPRAFSLYSTAKVVPRQLDLLPGLRDLVDPLQSADDEKAILFLHPRQDRLIAREIDLRWMVTPRFGDGPETTFEAVAAADLQQAAAFTTMSQLPHAGEETHRFIVALTKALKTARIVLGKPAGVPAALARLVEENPVIAAAAPAPDRPLVSVVIPAWNGAHFLADAVGSILRQDYPAIEIIVVDDGSTDDIAGAVARLPVDVRFFDQPNSGPAVARNRGVREAAGELVAFLDVDDIWPDDHLSALIGAMEEGDDVVLGRAQLARIDPEDPSRHSFIGNPEETFPYYIGAALYRREAFRKVGLFDAELRFGEDSDWFLRARDASLAVRRLDHVTLIVRRHEGNMTNGRTLVELNPLRAFKKALDRRRQAEGGG